MRIVSTIIKPVILLPLFFQFLACNSHTGSKPEARQSQKDTVVVHDTIIAAQQEPHHWQERFQLTHDPDKDSVWFQPVSYYLNDPHCSGLASDFYYGSLRPSDDGTTDELSKLATTDNNKLRPFYRWCLNMTIMIEDGALAEHTGIPARRYAEKFPKEFFDYMDFDTTGQRYDNWVGSISYSGFYLKDDYKKPQEIAARMAKAMKLNCRACDGKMLRRIDSFAKECFN